VRVYELKRQQIVPAPIDEVFTFFGRPENLAKITPDRLGFVILTPLPIRMQAGTTIDYTIRVLGMRRHWTTLITDYDFPHRFVDVQLKGPYRFWHHTHTFESVEGGTLLVDAVRYILPFGLLAHWVFVRRQLESIFDYRCEIIAQRFGTTEA
jgi:ligand-binding SRPBCC domain-containing protein